MSMTCGGIISLVGPSSIRGHDKRSILSPLHSSSSSSLSFACIIPNSTHPYSLSLKKTTPKCISNNVRQGGGSSNGGGGWRFGGRSGGGGDDDEESDDLNTIEYELMLDGGIQGRDPKTGAYVGDELLLDSGMLGRDPKTGAYVEEIELSRMTFRIFETCKTLLMCGVFYALYHLMLRNAEKASQVPEE